MKVGIHVYCQSCKRKKAPHGRSISAVTIDSWCTNECDGYGEFPKPGCLFPRETAEDFGYECCDYATEEVEFEGGA